VSDAIEDRETCKEIVVERIAESELRGRGWFHPVRDGSKRSTVDHSDPSNLRTDIPDGNYGICASLPDTLVLIDIDDHKDGYDEAALTHAREHLPETLTFSSAHDGEGRLYHVPVDDDGRLPVKRLKDEFDKANVSAVTWGEIRTENQYIVGAGSQLDADGCTKDDCTRCAEPDGGRYTVLHDAPIATLPADDLVAILREDPGVGDADGGDEVTDTSGNASGGSDAAVTSEVTGVTSDDDRTGKVSESDGPDTSPYKAIDRLDAQRVAEETIVHGYNTDHSSGDGVEAFYPSWDPNCNGTANVVGSDGWDDTGGRGRGGPIEMAAIDCGELPHDEDVQPGDVTGDEWRQAYEHLRDLGFDDDLPPLSPTSLRDLEEVEDVDEAATALDALLNLYEGDADRDMDHWREIWTAVGKLDDEQVDDYADRVSAVCGVAESEVSQHAADIAREDANGAPVVVEDGKTWYLAGLPRRRHELLNFEIDVDSTLKVERGPLRARLTATLPNGDEFTKPIEPKVFNKKERFDDEILSESFATTFNVPQTNDGGVYVQDLLDALKMWVHHQDAPRRTGVRHMGLHGSEIATPTGTLDADGWTDDPDHVYLEREIGAERRVSLPETDEYDADDVASILETLPYTRDTERLLPVLGWFYAAPLRPVIESFSESGEFNHLSVTGDTGSGKTTTLGYLWRCFGMAGEPFSVDASTFAQLATFASTNSIPLWFDEYKPSDIREYKVNKFHDLYRKATRGAFAERGNADKTTTSYKIQAPVVVSGEQAIQGPAERRRSVMTQFRTETTDAGTDTAEAYKQLVGAARVDDDEVTVADGAPDPGDHALAFYRYVTGLDDADVQERWYDALEYAHDHLSDLGVVEEMDDLEIQGVQTVVFGFEMMRSFARHVGADTDALPDYDALDDALTYAVGRIGPGGQRKSHADRFVEIFGRAAAAEYVERGTHYELVREGEETEEIRVNLPRTYDAVSKYARDHDVDAGDLLNDHGDYRDRFTEMADDASTYVARTRQYTQGVSQCTGLRTTDVVDAVEFDRSVLDSEAHPPGTTGTDPTTETDDSDGDGDGGGLPTNPETVAIDELEPSKQTYGSVEAGVEFGEYDGINDGDGPAWKATLNDGTGTAKLVAWDEEKIPRFYNSKGVFDAEALEVRGAVVGEYKGEPQLEIREITKIHESAEPESAALPEQTQAATDGGNNDTAADTSAAAETDEPRSEKQRFATAYTRAESDDSDFVEYDDLFHELTEFYDDGRAERMIEKAKTRRKPAWIIAVADRTFRRGDLPE